MEITDKYILNKVFTGKTKRFNWRYIKYHITQEERDYLQSRFSDSTSITETLYRMFYKIYKRPVCVICGNPVEFRSGESCYKDNDKIFKKCCCKECENKYRNKQKLIGFKTKLGVDNPAQLESVKNKIKETTIKHFGKVALASDIIRKKYENTCLERYGVKNGGGSKQSIEKIKRTCLEKYGEDNPWKCEFVKEKIRNTTFNRYGAYFYQQSDEFQKIKNEIYEKQLNTTYEHYGTYNWFESDDYLIRKNEIKEKYENGIKKYYKSEKYKQNKILNSEKYAISYFYFNDELQEKRKNTFYKNYGTYDWHKSDDFLNRVDEINNKICKTTYNNYGTYHWVNSYDYQLRKNDIFEKIKETSYNRYGAYNWNSSYEYVGHKSEFKNKEYALTYFNTYVSNNDFDLWYSGQKDNIQEKRLDTNYNTYGAYNWYNSHEYSGRKNEFNSKEEAYSYFCSYVNSDNFDEWYNGKGKEIQKKINDTKRKNKTFNKSIPEDECYVLLKEKYPDVIRQYQSDLYPFACDFYIPSIDLYIECNFMWTHGFHPYNENDNDDIEKLNSWKEKSKTSDFYKNAIYTWTDLDIRKKKIAKQNKLNYKVFYYMNDFYNWYNNI